MLKHVKLSGRVEDFNGNPLEGATVRLDNHRFTPVVEVLTDENGCYEIEAEPGLYHDIFICKDYGVHNLEYWAWDIPLFEDRVINARIDGLEIYSLRAFRVKYYGIKQVMLYFRPMSLAKGKQFKEDKSLLEGPIINIAPELHKEDIEVRIEGVPSTIYAVNKVLESAGENQHIYAYLVHVSHEPDLNYNQYHRIDLTLTDRDTHEKGEGTVFWKETEVI